MNESETFGAEKEYAEMVIAWMNEEAKKRKVKFEARLYGYTICLLYTSPSPRDLSTSRMPSSA